MSPLEYCQLCNSETGRAGRYDDSMYLDIPHGDEVGPLCEECYSAFGKAMESCKKDIFEAETQSAQPTSKAGSEDYSQIFDFVNWVASFSKAEYAAHQQLVAIINQAQKLLPC